MEMEMDYKDQNFSFLEGLQDIQQQVEKHIGDPSKYMKKIITPVYGINYSEGSIERILFPPQIFIDHSFPTEYLGDVFEYYTGMSPFIGLECDERFNNLSKNNDYYIHNKLTSVT
jgi:hypothetical protein